jgi:uncharacterized protein
MPVFANRWSCNLRYSSYEVDTSSFASPRLSSAVYHVVAHLGRIFISKGICMVSIRKLAFVVAASIGLSACASLDKSVDQSVDQSAPQAKPAATAAPSTPQTTAAAAPACPAPLQPTTEARAVELFKNAKDRGVLWTIEKGGHKSYLYGTIHVNSEEWMLPGAKTAAALAQSDLLALEIDQTDPAVQQDMVNALKPDARTPQLPKALAERMKAASERACLPYQAIAAMHPMMQQMTVQVMDLRFINLEAAYGVEMALTQFATARKIPISSLESASLQMRSLTSMDDKAMNVLIERGLDDMEKDKTRKLFKQLHAYWANGDLEQIENYEQWCDCVKTSAERDMLKVINDGRNPGLADGIDKLHRSGKKVFAAVGALHMTGNAGIPKLMREKGYKVERVVF